MAGIYIDVSQFNSPDEIDYAVYTPFSAQGDGVARIAIRVGQGVGVVDPDFLAHLEKAKAGGVKQFIFYWFVYPWLHPGWQGAAAEAQSFKTTLGGRLGADDYLMMDAEAFQGHSGPADWHYDFLSDLELGFQIPASRIPAYSYPAYIQSNLQDARLARYPLIQADWTGSTSPVPPATAPFTRLLGWQYSDKAIIPGVAHPVDVNMWFGPPTPGTPPPTNKEKILAQLDAINASVVTIRGLL